MCKAACFTQNGQIASSDLSQIKEILPKPEQLIPAWSIQNDNLQNLANDNLENSNQSGNESSSNQVIKIENMLPNNCSIQVLNLPEEN